MNKKELLEEIVKLDIEVSENFPHYDLVNKEVVLSLIDQLDEPPVMKSLTKEEHNALHTYENGAITKPTHYLDKHGKDLYQKWYEEHDFETFRHIMRSIAERYTSRYENKNGFEDLDKGIYTLQRLREYEEMEK